MWISTRPCMRILWIIYTTPGKGWFICEWYIIAGCVLLTSGTNPHTEQGLPVHDAEFWLWWRCNSSSWKVRCTFICDTPMWEAILSGNVVFSESSQNVLFVNVRYYFPFTLHRNTWKTTSFTFCLVNMWKYILRWNSLGGKTPSVYFHSSACIAIAKSIHDVNNLRNTSKCTIL